MAIKNRNLFRLTRFVLLKLPRLLEKIKRNQKEKRILIVKLDAIGDYVLFRNYLKFLNESPKFKEYKIDLLGNILWKDIAEHFDADVVSKFIFINPESLYESPIKALKLGLSLYKANYSITLQPAFSRTLIGDGLAALSSSKYIVGYNGNDERINAKYKKTTDKFYTRVLNLPIQNFHEIERNHYFFQEVTGQKIDLIFPQFNLNQERKNTVIIFPGAGVVKRNWEPQKFRYIIEKLVKETSLDIILMGSNGDIKLSESLVQNLSKERITDLTGRTTLVEVVHLIASATMLIANETSAIHIAAACNTPSICILGGGHFSRFVPYPSNCQAHIHYINTNMYCYNCNWECKFSSNNSDEPFPCISEINERMVWQKMEKIIIKEE